MELNSYKTSVSGNNTLLFSKNFDDKVMLSTNGASNANDILNENHAYLSYGSCAYTTQCDTMYAQCLNREV